MSNSICLNIEIEFVILTCTFSLFYRACITELNEDNVRYSITI